VAADEPLTIYRMRFHAEFMTVNPDCLAIALEPVTEDGLREAALATLSADRDTLVRRGRGP
jgi:hypothetical protein